MEDQETCPGHLLRVGPFPAVIPALYFTHTRLLLQGCELGPLSLFAEVGE